LFVLDLINEEEIKNVFGVIISSGVEKMILMTKMILSSDRGRRFIV